MILPWLAFASVVAVNLGGPAPTLAGSPVHCRRRYCSHSQVTRAHKYRNCACFSTSFVEAGRFLERPGFLATWLRRRNEQCPGLQTLLVLPIFLATTLLPGQDKAAPSGRHISSALVCDFLWG